MTQRAFVLIRMLSQNDTLLNALSIVLHLVSEASPNWCVFIMQLLKLIALVLLYPQVHCGQCDEEIVGFRRLGVHCELIKEKVQGHFRQ
jgi:apolipoprotein N-acyltransferase